MRLALCVILLSNLRRRLPSAPDRWLRSSVLTTVTGPPVSLSSAVSLSSVSLLSSATSSILVCIISELSPLDELDCVTRLSDRVRDGMRMFLGGRTYREGPLRPSPLIGTWVLTTRRSVGRVSVEDRAVGSEAARGRSFVEMELAGLAGTMASDTALRRPTVGIMRWTALNDRRRGKDGASESLVPSPEPFFLPCAVLLPLMLMRRVLIVDIIRTGVPSFLSTEGSRLSGLRSAEPVAPFFPSSAEACTVDEGVCDGGVTVEVSCLTLGGHFQALALVRRGTSIIGCKPGCSSL
ncbi:hypothetical protein DAEQUDRAFT_462118 [Daedalea quercina L-15889]|uniref:Uncharacterized protein n=1 Tax=Daedalea quercina L-15889 TaxID=1314783 RepID=A0A165TDG1_9APHY|nr:hypothetical protein DAEQUDRAFT_462118 [Daedalea quercina L-15889]